MPKWLQSILFLHLSDDQWSPVCQSQGTRYTSHHRCSLAASKRSVKPDHYTCACLSAAMFVFSGIWNLHLLSKQDHPDVVSFMKAACSTFRSAPLLRLNWLSSWKIMIYRLDELTLMSLSILSLLLRSWLLMQRLFPVKAVNAFIPVGCVFPTLFAHETCWSALMSVLQLCLYILNR